MQSSTHFWLTFCPRLDTEELFLRLSVVQCIPSHPEALPLTRGGGGVGSAAGEARQFGILA